MKLLIELPSWIGDSVMVTPAIENIIKIYPNIEITVLGPKTCNEIFLNHPLVVSSIVIERNFTFLINAYKFGVYDLFISFRNSYRTKFLKFFIKSKSKFQYSKKKYSQGHQVERYNSFVNDITGSEFSPGKLKIYSKKLQLKAGKRKKIGINPGAAFGSAKCWPIKHYASLLEELSDQFDIEIFGGPNEEMTVSSILESLTSSSKKNIKNLAGRTTIQELISHFSDLTFLVTGDSGPMHIASALQIPTISLFGPTKMNETCQWKPNKSSVNIIKNIECQPCMKRECPLGHHSCMELITPQEVIKKINRYLEK